MLLRSGGYLALCQIYRADDVLLGRAGDFLLNIPVHERLPPAHLPSSSSTGFRTSTPNRTMSSRHSMSFADDSNMLTDDEIQVHDDLFALEEDLYIAARETFNSREFEKTAFVLKECKSPKCRFLCVYSRFLVRFGIPLSCYTRYINRITS